MLQAFLVGNVTKDLELKSVTSTKKGEEKPYQVCTFTVANNRVGDDKTDFIDVEVWGKQAEACVKYLKKGSGVALIGDLCIDEYTVDGVKKTRVVIRDAEVQFTDKRPALQS